MAGIHIKETRPVTPVNTLAEPDKKPETKTHEKPEVDKPEGNKAKVPGKPQ